MSDIFHEVEEEVRRERFEKLWKQYGDYIIAGVALIVIAIAGYELWTRYQENQRVKASETLILAQQLADSGNFVKSTESFGTLAKDAPGGYGEIARLSRASVLLAQNKRDEALAIYKSIAAEDSGPLGGLALVRAGWILADTASPGEVQTLLAPLMGSVDVASGTWPFATHRTEPNAWQYPAREVLAYTAYHNGDVTKAKALFKALGDDKNTPDGMRHRAAAMATFLANGGLKDFGAVPAAPAPVTPPAAAAGTPTTPAVAPATPAPSNGTPPK